MQHNRKLDHRPFIGPFYIKKKSPREQLLQNNHEDGSRPKEFNKNTDTSNNTGSPQDTIFRSCPRMNSDRFGDPYEHIKPTYNTHEDTHHISTQE